MNKNANMMALVLAILFLVTTVTPIHAPARPISPTYLKTGTLTASVDGVVLATFNYRLSGYRNSRIWFRGTLQVYEPTILILEVRVWVQILEGYWWGLWWDLSDDWDPRVPVQAFSSPSAGSYYANVYTYDKKRSNTIHYKVAACLSVDYFKIWGVYGTTTNFWQYDMDL